ncbi:hypothetical protein [Acetobacterium sp.]|uniref:hypothetical protein n=1 Tax=Acetobacterium sp. TaxID=1872094 RepID=UPI002F3E8915
MNIEFKKFSEFQRGIIYELLKNGYSFESRYERDWTINWKETSGSVGQLSRMMEPSKMFVEQALRNCRKCDQGL